MVQSAPRNTRQTNSLSQIELGCPIRILARFFAARYRVDHKYTATLIARTQFDLNELWFVKILGLAMID